MGTPPVIPVERKTTIVPSILAGEKTIAEATQREKLSEQSIGRWKAGFLETGKTGLAAGEIRVWKTSAEGRLGPSRTSW